MENSRGPSQKVVHKREDKEERKLEKIDKSKCLRVMYTNVDGLITSKLELQDFIKEKEPMIVCLTETKLNEAIKLEINKNYDIWRKDRMGKGGGGVMIMTKKELTVKVVEYGEGKAEIAKVNVETKNKERLTIITAYVPPRTNSWCKEEHDTMINDTIRSLSKMLKENKKSYASW